MKIGYAQAVITPSLDRPVYLAGFGNNRRSESVRAACLHVPGLSKNARNPEIVDDEMTLAQFLDAKDRH